MLRLSCAIPSHKQPPGAIIKGGDRKRSEGSTLFHRNSQLRYFHSKLRHPQRHKLAREPANLRGSRVEFQELGDRLATLIESSLNFPSAYYLINNACAVKD